MEQINKQNDNPKIIKKEKQDYSIITIFHLFFSHPQTPPITFNDFIRLCNPNTQNHTSTHTHITPHNKKFQKSWYFTSAIQLISMRLLELNVYTQTCITVDVYRYINTITIFLLLKYHQHNIVVILIVDQKNVFPTNSSVLHTVLLRTTQCSFQKSS